MTRCPHCEHEFDAKRSLDGASYAKEWNVLPSKNMKILKWWLFNVGKDKLTMTKLYNLFVETEGTIMKRNPFQARVSELRGCGLVHATKHEKISPRDTTGPPLYSLNDSFARSVIINSGRLRDDM
jgi:hypothetical protein